MESIHPVFWFIWLICGAVTAIIAGHKNRNVFVWLLIGLGIPVLVVVLVAGQMHPVLWLWLVCGVVTAILAGHKNRPVFGWLLLGFFSPSSAS